MNKDKFRFFAPVDFLEKAKDKKGNDVYRVGGIISDTSTDADGEKLDPNGFDFSEFNYINWNHGKSPSDIIGEPESWKVTPKGVYMEGYIYPESDKGQEAVQLMRVLGDSKKGNQLGWSVEGQVLERDLMDESKVTKARITAVALCPFPKNGNTFAELLRKGFNDDSLFQDNEELEYENVDEDGNIIKETLEDGSVVVVDKEGNIVVKKAQSTENSSALIEEDVEGNAKDLLKSAIVTIVDAHRQGFATDEQLEKCKNFVKFLDK